MQQYDESQNNFAKWKKPESPLRNVHAMTAFIRTIKKCKYYTVPGDQWLPGDGGGWEGGRTKGVQRASGNFHGEGVFITVGIVSQAYIC